MRAIKCYLPLSNSYCVVCFRSHGPDSVVCNSCNRIETESTQRTHLPRGYSGSLQSVFESPPRYSTLILLRNNSTFGFYHIWFDDKRPRHRHASHRRICGFHIPDRRADCGSMLSSPNWRCHVYSLRRNQSDIFDGLLSHLYDSDNNIHICVYGIWNESASGISWCSLGASAESSSRAPRSWEPARKLLDNTIEGRNYILCHQHCWEFWYCFLRQW